MCMIGEWGMVTSTSTSQLVPYMLNGVQIWRIRWPIHPVDIDDIELPKKVCNNSCTMRSGVVILKHGRRTNTLERRYDKGLDNLLQIAISVQVTINDIKRSPIIERKGTPNHTTATTKRQRWLTLTSGNRSPGRQYTCSLPWLNCKANQDSECNCRRKNKCTWKIEICFGMGRKHCVKRRKCWFPAFSPFPTVFSKGFSFRVVKIRDCVVKT